jgi:GT2 family glycosyltransferase
MAATDGLSVDFFVVDNASSDGSAEMVAQDFPTVKLIANESNLGYGKANNQALEQCRGKYVLIINPDTLVPEDAVHRLMDFIEKHPRSGMVAPEMIDGQGRILFNMARWYPRSYAEFLLEKLVSVGKRKTNILFTQPRRLRMLAGACWLARYEAISQIGFFDGDLFMFGEEPDVCARMRKAGWDLWLIRDTTIVHYGRQGIGQRGRLVESAMFLKSIFIWLFKRWRKLMTIP